MNEKNQQQSISIDVGSKRLTVKTSDIKSTNNNQRLKQ